MWMESSLPGMDTWVQKDWLVYITLSLPQDYIFSTIKDVVCEATATEAGAVCVKCIASRKALMQHITNTADLCHGPFCARTNNCILAQAPTLLEQIVKAQRILLKILRSTLDLLEPA